MLVANLKDAILELDELLLKTLGGLIIEGGGEHYRITLKFALYGPSLESLGEPGGAANEVEQYPDRVFSLSREADPADQIRELEECELLGNLHAFQIPPGSNGNAGAEPKWIVKAHAGSTAERIAWLASIA